MTVDRSKTPYRSEYAGRTFYFCGAGCKASFDVEPEHFTQTRSLTEPERIRAESNL
jgi:Cu+-exporting ATPase